MKILALCFAGSGVVLPANSGILCIREPRFPGKKA